MSVKLNCHSLAISQYPCFKRAGAWLSQNSEAFAIEPKIDCFFATKFVKGTVCNATIQLWYICQRDTFCFDEYRKVSNIRRTLVGNNIVDHSDVVGASPVGAAPTTSSFST